MSALEPNGLRTRARSLIVWRAAVTLCKRAEWLEMTDGYRSELVLLNRRAHRGKRGRWSDVDEKL